jgi:hypothetical protein
MRYHSHAKVGLRMLGSPPSRCKMPEMRESPYDLSSLAESDSVPLAIITAYNVSVDSTVARAHQHAAERREDDMHPAGPAVG